MIEVGEKMLKRANFCKEKCPICTRGRKGNKIARGFTKHFCRKVCPYCKAYEQIFKKKAYE
ncbi:MAG: hypothetical protein QFX40_02420 [Archaeoglobales archaeon]|nr:hypothetical protein [Archaeoglobales archaeon]